jgi:pimeloyl-ACP methyl ester carboxylesterase
VISGTLRAHSVALSARHTPCGAEYGEIRSLQPNRDVGGAKAHYDGVVAFSQTDFTPDLKKVSVSKLVMHGDDDQIVPYADSGPLSAKLLEKGILKTYKGSPHGMLTTQADTINADILVFIKLIQEY